MPPTRRRAPGSPGTRGRPRSPRAGTDRAPPHAPDLGRVPRRRSFDWFRKSKLSTIRFLQRNVPHVARLAAADGRREHRLPVVRLNTRASTGCRRAASSRSGPPRLVPRDGDAVGGGPARRDQLDLPDMKPSRPLRLSWMKPNGTPVRRSFLDRIGSALSRSATDREGPGSSAFQRG